MALPWPPGSSHACASQASAEDSRNPPQQTSPFVSFCTVLYSPALGPAISAPWSAFLETQLCLLNSGSCQVLPGLLPLLPGQENSRQRAGWSHNSLIGLSSLRSHCPSLPSAQIFENRCSIDFFFIAFWLFQVGWVYQLPLTPSCREAEVSLFNSMLLYQGYFSQWLLG